MIEVTGKGIQGHAAPLPGHRTPNPGARGGAAGARTGFPAIGTPPANTRYALAYHPGHDGAA
ncbi:hypothetical protein GCM10010182_58810 [Actinomadura cremea]|nr:hypothetical protein GCM10010182_58810 [Actinomadura cremea]